MQAISIEQDLSGGRGWAIQASDFLADDAVRVLRGHIAAGFRPALRGSQARLDDQYRKRLRSPECAMPGTSVILAGA